MAAFPKAYLAFAILAILATSQANALILDGQLIRSLNLLGILSCSSNGANNGGSPPLANVRITVRVNGLAVASATTGPDGSIRVSITSITLLNSILSLSTITLSIPLPISTCNVFRLATGTLQGGVLRSNLVNGVLDVVPDLLRVV